MRIDDLTRELHDARDHERPADVAAGRDAVAAAVRRHQTRRLVAIAACVLLLLGAFAATISRVGKGDPGYGTSTEGIPKLVPTNLPDGLRIKHLSQQPVTLSALRLEDLHVSVFAKPGAVAPNDSFAVTKAKVAPRLGYGSAPPTTEAADPAKIETDDDGTRMSVRSDPGGAMVVTSSRGLADAQLIAVTRAVRFLPSGAVDPSSIPIVDGVAYEPVVGDATTWWMGAGGSTLATAEYTQIYAAPSPSPTGAGPPGATNPLGANNEKSLALLAQRAAPADLELARWMVPQAREVTVRGHRAVGGGYTLTVSRSTAQVSSGSDLPKTGSTPAGNGAPPPVEKVAVGTFNVLVWLENDASMVQLASANYSVDELVRIAEGLRTDASDFRDLQALTTTTTLPQGCTATADGGSVCHTVGSAVSGSTCTTVAPPTTTADGRTGSGAMQCQGVAIADDSAPTSKPGLEPSATAGSGSRSAPGQAGAVAPPATTVP